MLGAKLEMEIIRHKTIRSEFKWDFFMKLFEDMQKRTKIIRFFKQRITPIPSTNDMVKQMRHPYPPCPSHAFRPFQNVFAHFFDKNSETPACLERFFQPQQKPMVAGTVPSAKKRNREPFNDSLSLQIFGW